MQAFELNDSSDSDSPRIGTEIQIASNQSPICEEEVADIEVASTQTLVPVTCGKEIASDYQARCKSKENSQFEVQASVASSSRAVAAHSKLGKRLAIFDAFVDQSGGTNHIKSKFDYYLEESVIPRSEDFDILCWWKTNGSKYPTLQAIARDVLAILVSTVASESAFSTSVRFVSPHCSRLHLKTLEALMCAQNWLCDEFNDADSSNKVGNSKFSEDEDIVGIVLDGCKWFHSWSLC